jgi:glutathione S-transferase
MPTPSLTLYGSPKSGHSHRAELMLRMLGLPYDYVPMTPDDRTTEAFRKMNPLGQVPVLKDGDTIIADSTAILVYLAKRYAPNSHWLPDDAVTAAQIQRWLSVASGELYNGPNSARLMAVFGRPGNPETALAVSTRLLNFMESHLQDRKYLVGDNATIADLACYAYVAHAPEGGIDLQPYPSVRSWLKAVEALPNFKPMPASPLPKSA